MANEELLQDTPLLTGSGFDAPGVDRNRDYLNRWPFAREIYGIVTTSPAEWSVRIGVYGEWGTGKTTVLNYLTQLARADNHIVVPFNPWQFGSLNELWREFVKALFENLEKDFGKPLPGAKGRIAKRVSGTVAAALPQFIRLWREDAGKAAETGLSYVRRFMAFGPDDLKQLRESLGARRIIILIDDLDRTDQSLVPGMLFALKEIMDVRGFAFVCAFDPVVVGEVLGRLHPGFGDGLKFLDKIIDYPRWIRDPTETQLARLATADASEHCPYVPADALARAVPLLPANPRAIRQFVRLLTLLKPQIDRHLEREIHWPILLAANVLKVRFPKIAPTLLGNKPFWGSMRESLRFNESDTDPRKQLIADETEKLALAHGLDTQNKSALERGIAAIAEKMTPWLGIGDQQLLYQFHLAEEPCAVTWKEFHKFLDDRWASSPRTDAVSEWIRDQAIGSNHSQDEVFAELLEAATSERLTALNQAADATLKSKESERAQHASSLADLLSVLILELGRIETSQPRVTSEDVKKLLDSFAQFYEWRGTATWRKARRSEEELLTKMTESWGSEILVLADGIGVHRWQGHHDLKGPEWQKLVKRLRQILLAKIALWIINKFETDAEFYPGVIYDENHGLLVREILLDRGGPLWKDRREQMLIALGKTTQPTVRGNIYNVLQWFDHLLRKVAPEAAAIETLLKDAEVVTKFWRAVFAEPLSLRAVAGIRTLFKRCQEHGLSFQPPKWWDRIVSELDERTSKTKTVSTPLYESEDTPD